MAPVDGTLAERCAVPAATWCGSTRVDLPDATVAAIGLSGVAAWGRRWCGPARGRRAGAGAGCRRRRRPGRDRRRARRTRRRARGRRVPTGGVRRARSPRLVRTRSSRCRTSPTPRLLAASIEALGGPAHVVVDPVFGWVADAATPGVGAARPTGQPRRLRRRRRDTLVGGAERQDPRCPRLHQQRADPRATGRGTHRRRRPGRRGPGDRRAPGPPARRGRRLRGATWPPAACGRC